MQGEANMKQIALNIIINRGWYIFPVHSVYDGKCTCNNSQCTSQGKHPRVKAWQEVSTNNDNKIIEWWERWPDSNLGLDCGKSNIFVIDIDPDHGGKIETIIKLIKGSSNTLISHTGGGGYHMFYTTNHKISNTAGKLGQGIDTRGYGGLVVLPPSTHKSGNCYSWFKGHEVLPLPQKIVDILKTEEKKIELSNKTEGNQIQSGQRNVRITSLAGYLRRGGLEADEIYPTLTAFNNNRCHPPLDDYELKTISESISRYKPEIALDKEIDYTKIPYKLLNIETLAKLDIPQPEMIIDPWLATQQTAMIYGWRGIGKTHFSLGLAACLSSGSKFMKWYIQKPRKVLFIDGEMGLGELKERLSIIKTENPVDTENLNFLTPDYQDRPMLKITDKKDQEAIQAFVDASEVIIIDNLSTLTSETDEKETESWDVVQNWFLQLRHQKKTVLFFHHAGKAGMQRGTSRREDMLHTVICLKQPWDSENEEGARFEIIFEKSRGVKGEDIKPIEATLHEGNWLMKDIDNNLEHKVIDMLKMKMNPQAIKTELGWKSLYKTIKLCKKLERFAEEK